LQSASRTPNRLKFSTGRRVFNRAGIDFDRRSWLAFSGQLESGSECVPADLSQLWDRRANAVPRPSSLASRCG